MRLRNVFQVTIVPLLAQKLDMSPGRQSLEQSGHPNYSAHLLCRRCCVHCLFFVQMEHLTSQAFSQELRGVGLLCDADCYGQTEKKPKDTRLESWKIERAHV